MNKLFIDTSTQALIIILYYENKVIDYIFDETKNNHSEKLISSVEILLLKNEMKINQIDEFYVTEGPGSYTGVRIGVTVAKMLAYSLKKPLYKISSLKVIAASYMNDHRYIIPLIDARRGNAFTSLYQVKDHQLINLKEDLLYHVEDFMHEVKKQVCEQVVVVGLDAALFKELFKDDSQFILFNQLRTEFKPEKIILLNFEKVLNIHSFVPNYKRLAEAEMNLL